MQCPQCKSPIEISAQEFGANVGCGSCGEIVEAPESRLAPGMMLGGDFVIKATFGSGGMATIYLADQISLQREVALKVLHPEHAADNEQVQGFMREARSVAQLNHPGIVQIYYVGEEEGYYFFAMESVMGASVKEILQQDEKPALEWSLDVARKIALSLNHAWKNGNLVHRDIKPDNIIIRRDGRVKLADLGLAKPAESLREFGDEVEGTPQYISPEGILGDPMDFRSDIYSLGATLYHMVTGGFPFEGETPNQTAEMHVEAPLQPPHERNPDVPAYVSKVISRMMEKKPENRYQSLEELADALKVTTSKLRRAARTDTSRTSRTRKLDTDSVERTQVVTLKPSPDTGTTDRLMRLVLIGAAIVVLGAIALLIYAAVSLRDEPYHAPLDRGQAGDKPKPEPVVEDPFDTAGLAPGFLGEYFHGQSFEKFILARADQTISLENAEFKDLLGRTENLSIRWTGKLPLKKDVRYTLHCRSDDGQRLWINGINVINDWEEQPAKWQQKSVTVRRSGLYELCYEYYQGEGDGEVRIEWEGEGEFDRRQFAAGDVFHDPTSVVSRGLVLHFRFDETTGDVTKDASRKDHIGSLSGKVEGISTGQVIGAGAVAFAGGLIQVSHSDVLALSGPVAVSLWLKPTNFASQQCVLMKGKDARSSPISLVLEKETGKVMFGVGDGKNWSRRKFDHDGLRPDQWQHVVAVCHHSKRFTLFVDGRQVDEGDRTEGNGKTVRPRNQREPLHIGRRHDKDPFRGVIDDLRIFKRQINGKEVELLYALGAKAAKASAGKTSE